MNNNINFLQKDLDKRIKNICKNNKEDDELEVSFGNYKHPISLKCFHDLLNLFKIKSSKIDNKINHKTTLDILYNYDNKSISSYRLTISEINKINNFIDNNRNIPNNILFSKLINQYINQEDDEILLINKIKNSDNYIELSEYDIKIKLSEEIKNINKSKLEELSLLKNTEQKSIFYRYKQRYNLVVDSTEDYIISFDLTDVKSNNKINNLYDSDSQYELELDITFKKHIKNLDNILSKMSNYIFILEKFLQQSNILVTKTETNNILKCLNKLIYDNENETYKDLPSMQVTSVEIYHIIDIIPGNYTITDKADGERFFMMVFENNIYLISNNLIVKKIKENVPNKYNLSIIDGEYLYIGNPYNKYLFLPFDILFFEGKDIRSEELIHKRLIILNKFLLDLFKIDVKIGYYDKEYNIDNIIKFHKDNINKHLINLIKNLTDSNDNNIINGKYFIVPTNIGNQNDIYKLSQVLYDTYTNGLDVKCPYILDGIIYTPLMQKYSRSKKDTKFNTLKWKPEQNNSIDFYIEFERDPSTNKIFKVFDRTINKDDIDEYNEEQNEEKSIFYQIANLYVGKVKNNVEDPVLFQKENNNHIAYLILTDNYPRDVNGYIIEDKTVVEMTYDNISLIHNNFRWKPLRTRYDKTESVIRFNRKYGNNNEIANRIWNSIINPVRYEDIKLLSNDQTYDNHIKLLKQKVNAETINIMRKDDIYYQLITNIGKTMRTYINWIKSNIIYSICQEKYKNKLDVLDIGIGRGGDINKFYHARVNKVIGIDQDESGIYSGSDGAYSRYKTFKKKFPNFPKMIFFVADARLKLDYFNQKTLGNLNEDSIKNIKDIFGEDEKSTKIQKFDIFNMQMMIHYIFDNINSFENLCYNINKYLKKGGLILITVFDGNLVDKKFINSEIKKCNVSEDGKNMLLYHIIKRYNNFNFNDLSYKNNFGNQIDIYNSSFSEEGVYIPEYLVNSKFLIKEFYEKCNLKLMDTELFHNMYIKYKNFFDYAAPSESRKETNEFFKNIKEFYNLKDSSNKAWIEWFNLFRYYIFMKID